MVAGGHWRSSNCPNAPSPGPPGATASAPAAIASLSGSWHSAKLTHLCSAKFAHRARLEYAFSFQGVGLEGVASLAMHAANVQRAIKEVRRMNRDGGTASATGGWRR